MLQAAVCPLANPLCFENVNSHTVNPIEASNTAKVIENTIFVTKRLGCFFVHKEYRGAIGK